MNLRNSTWLFLCLALMAGCGQSTKTESTETAEQIPVIIASNYPLMFFAQSMLGNAAEVKMLAPNDVDPAHWTPSVDDILAMQQSNLVILNGATYEPWLEKSSLPTSKLFNSSEGLKEAYIQYQEGPAHSHGPEGEHTHMGTAFSLWLDLDLAAQQATAVKDALVEKFPSSSENINTEYEKLIAELQSMDTRLKDASSKIGSQRLLFSHPVYQYLQRRYNIKGASLTWEPNMEIDHDMWHDLEHEIDHHPAQWMIWEKEPLASSKERLSKAGIQSIVFKTISNSPAEGDFISVMNDNIDQLELIGNR